MKRRSIDSEGRAKLNVADGYENLFDPPSLGDRPTPLPAHRVMVIGDAVDDGHDAPTVAVRDLAMLGIDITDLAGTAPHITRRPAQATRKPPARFETPESSPVRAMTPDVAPRASAPTEIVPSPLTLVTAVAIPLVLGCCVAAWWMISA
ncbi:MAG: hypothetical protein AB8H79_20940 [Myxococcota bacterium]